MTGITLTWSGGTLALPPHLIWTDRYDWAAPQSSLDYSLTGAALIDVGVRQSGRPITLAGGDTWGWISKTDLDTLRALADVPGTAYQLAIHAEPARNVLFDHREVAVQARAVVDYTDPIGSTWYVPTLRFIEA